ncbi:MAG: serine hydrolase domain-containing protein [Promethearchaeota archaeon]
MRVNLKKTMLIFVILMLTNVVMITGVGSGQVKTAATVYWPTNEWNDTNPSDQDMDNSTIYDMYNYIDTNNINIHSVSIVRNGFLIHEEYLIGAQLRSGDNYGSGHPADQVINETLHVQWSATKTITALLIGIAIDKGYINNVSQTFSSVFPTLTYSSSNKENITIEHLLTMSSGIYGDSDPEMFAGAWNKTIQEILNPDLYFTPGTDFKYSSFSTTLLSAIINKTTGQKTSEFAEDNLFDPLGISREEWYWEENSEGISYGGFGLWFTPQAMSRIGLLMLNNGNWNGTQVISENWMLEMGTPRPVSSGYYGYLVWMSSWSYYAAGLGGQCIFLIPENNLVVVFTAGVYPGNPTNDYIYIIENFIIGAIISPPQDPGIPGYSLMVFLPLMIVGIAFFSKKMKNKSSLILK